MRFTQFLRRLGERVSSRAYNPRYRLTIVGSSNSLQSIKQPLYQDLRSIGASITRAQSALLHEGQHACTELTIHCTADRPLGLNRLALKLGQKDGIRRVHVEGH